MDSEEEIHRPVMNNTRKYILMEFDLGWYRVGTFFHKQRWALVMWTVHYISPESQSFSDPGLL